MCHNSLTLGTKYDHRKAGLGHSNRLSGHVVRFCEALAMHVNRLAFDVLADWSARAACLASVFASASGESAAHQLSEACMAGIHPICPRAFSLEILKSQAMLRAEAISVSNQCWSFWFRLDALHAGCSTSCTCLGYFHLGECLTTLLLEASPSYSCNKHICVHRLLQACLSSAVPDLTSVKPWNSKVHTGSLGYLGAFSASLNQLPRIFRTVWGSVGLVSANFTMLSN